MSKHQNETISSRESHVCHLTHADQTARFWQFGRPVLGGNFWFPRWNSFILVFWHLYKAYLNVFTWICLLTFFLPYVSFKPTVYYETGIHADDNTTFFRNGIISLPTKIKIDNKIYFSTSQSYYYTSFVRFTTIN